MIRLSNQRYLTDHEKSVKIQIFFYFGVASSQNIDQSRFSALKMRSKVMEPKLDFLKSLISLPYQLLLLLESKYKI